MMGDILLGIVSLCTLISYVPQAIKIIKTKEADDLSLTTWIIWVISSFAYSLYGIFCTDQFMLKLETILEFSFCLLILLLTLKYRNNKSN